MFQRRQVRVVCPPVARSPLLVGLFLNQLSFVLVVFVLNQFIIIVLAIVGIHQPTLAPDDLSPPFRGEHLGLHGDPLRVGQLLAQTKIIETIVPKVDASRGVAPHHHVLGQLFLLAFHSGIHHATTAVGDVGMPVRLPMRHRIVNVLRVEAIHDGDQVMGWWGNAHHAQGNASLGVFHCLFDETAKRDALLIGAFPEKVAQQVKLVEFGDARRHAQRDVGQVGGHVFVGIARLPDPIEHELLVGKGWYHVKVIVGHAFADVGPSQFPGHHVGATLFFVVGVEDLFVVVVFFLLSAVYQWVDVVEFAIHLDGAIDGQVRDGGDFRALLVVALVELVEFLRENETVFTRERALGDLLLHFLELQGEFGVVFRVANDVAAVGQVAPCLCGAGVHVDAFWFFAADDEGWKFRGSHFYVGGAHTQNKSSVQLN